MSEYGVDIPQGYISEVWLNALHMLCKKGFAELTTSISLCTSLLTPVSLCLCMHCRSFYHDIHQKNCAQLELYTESCI